MRVAAVAAGIVMEMAINVFYDDNVFISDCCGHIVLSILGLAMAGQSVASLKPVVFKFPVELKMAKSIEVDVPANGGDDDGRLSFWVGVDSAGFIHTKHVVGPPKVGVYACARGTDKYTYCRYGCPWDRVPRDHARPVKIEKGLRECQWHAHFPRKDWLCCSHAGHVSLGNLGNIDWRTVLNLWAIVQYGTNYAIKAPKCLRTLRCGLDGAIEKVCTHVPEGEGSDVLRRFIQIFFARMRGARDYHVYEAVQIGLNLFLVSFLMPVISLNTAGAQPFRCYQELKDADGDAVVHYESRVDKFNKRLELLRKHRANGGRVFVVGGSFDGNGEIKKPRLE